MRRRMKKRTDELQYGLMSDVLNVVESYGLPGDQTLAALAGAITRVICIDAPDLSTAESWKMELVGTIHVAINQAAENGEAAWAKVRRH